MVERGTNGPTFDNGNLVANFTRVITLGDNQQMNNQNAYLHWCVRHARSWCVCARARLRMPLGYTCAHEARGPPHTTHARPADPWCACGRCACACAALLQAQGER
jgi:hypothetical protein